MLRFRTRQTESPSSFRPDWSLTAWLRFVEDEWRVYELDVDGKEIHLDDPQYLEYLKRPRPSANEGSAIGALRTINTAAVTYSSTFPDIGFPESLEVLGLPPQAEAAGDDGEGSGNTSSPNHAGLVDETLSTPPFEKSGYRFAYSKKSELEYSVTARPVRFGVSGTTNYFTDESGVIRFTREDREPTVEDDPLQ
jgi:type IV pilus assembly protein PilA